MIHLKDILTAAKMFDPNIVFHTPLEYNHSLSQKYGADIYLKREDLQLIRSYKIRGSHYFMKTLSEEEKFKGVVAASAGNHAQGVALNCSKLQIKGTIFMPQTTPSQKIRKTKKFGGDFVEIKLVGDSFDETYRQAVEYSLQNGSVFIHPFDDPKVITGQGTVGLEIINDFKHGEIDFLIAPIGGGGLISGLIHIFKELMPSTKIIGVEPEMAASMTISNKNGKITTLSTANTIAEGTAVKTVGTNTFEVVNSYIQQFETVPEGLIATKMLELLDDQGIILEGAGALSIAALENIKDQIKGKKVVCVLSGGNFDFGKLPEIQEKSLKYLGLKRYFIISFPQRPGALSEFLGMLGSSDDIVHFEYIKKSIKERGPALVGIETDNKNNFEKIVENMRKNNIIFEDITDNEIYFNFLV